MTLFTLLMAGIVFASSVLGKSVRQECVCTTQYDPFCSASGIRFGNGCLLACALRQYTNLRSVHFRRCGMPMDVTASVSGTSAKGKDCICTTEYDPFCSSDGIRFGNTCLLECARKQYPRLTDVEFTRCEAAEEDILNAL